MSLYAEYLTERTNDQILEVENGFATYRFIDNDTVYIVDIYVKPEVRKSKLASVMADEIAIIAKERGCTKMLGTCNPSTKGSTTSLKVLFSYGMELLSASNDLIVVQKEI